MASPDRMENNRDTARQVHIEFTKGFCVFCRCAVCARARVSTRTWPISQWRLYARCVYYAAALLRAHDDKILLLFVNWGIYYLEIRNVKEEEEAKFTPPICMSSEDARLGWQKRV